jgi:hypothetical protein
MVLENPGDNVQHQGVVAWVHITETAGLMRGPNPKLSRVRGRVES